MKIVWVVRAGPDPMTIAPIWQAMDAHNEIANACGPRFELATVHTGQHSHAQIPGVFFRWLALPDPHSSLGVSGNSHGEQVARITSVLAGCIEAKA